MADRIPHFTKCQGPGFTVLIEQYWAECPRHGGPGILPGAPQFGEAQSLLIARFRCDQLLFSRFPSPSFALSGWA